MARGKGVAALACVVVAGAPPNALAAGAQAPDYRVQPLCGAPSPRLAACTALRLVPATPTPADATPAVNVPTPVGGFLTPANLHSAYALPSETASSSTQAVAVIDAFDDPTAEADLGVFDSQFGLPACTTANGCFRKVNEHGQPSPLPAEQGEWAGEISIDVQMAHAICENCHVLLVEANSAELADLGEAVDTAVKAGASEISNSYEAPEETIIASFYEELSEEFYEHPGVAITASAGDCGYLNEACHGESASADFPASAADVIAVGGTTLSDEHKAWTSTAWDEGGSGCSQIFAAPAWQSAVANFAATGCGAKRSVADVAAVGDPKTGVEIYDSTPEGSAPTGWTVFGGTSVSSPIIAAEFALAGGSHGVAFPAATLYSHAGEPGAFFDVVAGANGTCAGTACHAAVGYDGPTGLGSPLGLSAFAVPETVETPVLASFSPASAITGSTVTIRGAGLGQVTEVDFGKLPAQFEKLSSTELQATVPNGAGKGKIAVKAATATATSKATFKPTLAVTSFKPQHGAPGTVVTIKGVGFGAGSSVAFDGVAAEVSSASAKKLKAIVPAGAGAGPISVANTAAPVGAVFGAASFTP
jgi:hypothetical protein